MRKAVLGILAAVLLPVLAGCGGGDGGGVPPFAADVLSTQSRDGDVTQDPIDTGSFTAAYATGTQNVLVGIEVDQFNPAIWLSESRGFLRFSLGSIPPDADVQSAVLTVFVNDVTPVPANGQAEIPVLVQLIDTDLFPSPFEASDFGVSALLSRSTFFRGDDAGGFVPIDVTSLLREALAQGLSEFEIRLIFDQVAYDNDPTTIARLVEIDDADETPSHRRIDFAPLLQVDYF